MKLALSSLNQAWKDQANNQAKCSIDCQLAAEHKADIIVFPEMTLIGFTNDWQGMEDTPDSAPTIDFFSTLAKQFGIHILFGHIAKNTAAYNRASLINPDGNTILTYDKIHPFALTDEHQHVAPGKHLPVTKIGDFNIAVTICYDLRFPSLFTALREQCDLVINIANWPKERTHHWKTLLAARAVDNQFYMAGINRTGIDGNNIEYEKSSVIFNADGTPCPAIPLSDSLDLFKIDIEELNLFRHRFNFGSSQQNDYRPLLK